MPDSLAETHNEKVMVILTRLDDKSDDAAEGIQSIKDKLEEVNGTVKLHEGRIVVLETKTKYILAGTGAILLTVMGIFVEGLFI